MKNLKMIRTVTEAHHQNWKLDMIFIINLIKRGRGQEIEREDLLMKRVMPQ